MLEEIVKQCLKRGNLTHIVGPPKSGKNTLLYHLVSKVRKGEKAIIIDAEISVSVQRLIEITKFKEIELERIIIIQTKNSYEQHKTVLNLHNLIGSRKIKFIAINGITNHFRNNGIKIGKANKYNILALQVAYLKEFAKKMKIAVIVTNQMKGERDKFRASMGIVGKKIFEKYVDTTFEINQVNEKLWSINSDKNFRSLYLITEEGIKVLD
ncbi:MAG: hypothetical protein K9W45_08820 [Candidatus Heimdallarchaeum aukensis]|uniref:RecA family profile 1 domain-containing protein n=1 Tax=Candidatus Heimdallarchaeum aukensis TaxID=2876573 RepID=A0A9Y1BIZ2_9ARCH|nr:MAG: hypothetical protein K9W45_08820 [Candidatus Heimdallarchaeum aukensis]